jgi:anti-sigma factor RsiW
MQPLTCHELVEILTDYLEGALSPSDVARVEEHLELCDGCVTYLEQMRETIRLAGLVTEEELPDAQKDELLAAFRNWKR